MRLGHTAIIRGHKDKVGSKCRFQSFQGRHNDVHVQVCASCSRHGFLYTRGWMQMVMAPNDLFSWNNRYNKYNVTTIFTNFLLKLCRWTHSVHARVLKPWRGSLPWPPAISFYHVFPPPLSGLNWRSLSPVPLPPKWRAHSLTRIQNTSVHVHFHVHVHALVHTHAHAYVHVHVHAFPILRHCTLQPKIPQKSHGLYVDCAN